MRRSVGKIQNKKQLLRKGKERKETAGLLFYLKEFRLTATLTGPMGKQELFRLFLLIQNFSNPIRLLMIVIQMIRKCVNPFNLLTLQQKKKFHTF